MSSTLVTCVKHLPVMSLSTHKVLLLKVDPWTSITGITWELGNAGSQASPQFY